MWRPIRDSGNASTTLPTRAAKLISRSTNSSVVMSISPSQVFTIFISQFSFFNFLLTLRFHPIVANTGVGNQRNVQFNRLFHFPLERRCNLLHFFCGTLDQ